MAKNNGRSYGYPNPFNEVGNTDPNTPDVTGKGLYYDGYDEVMGMHLQQTGPMVSTPNSESGRGVMGGPAPGEPQAANPKTGD
jgi:hypothetical protein